MVRQSGRPHSATRRPAAQLRNHRCCRGGCRDPAHPARWRSGTSDRFFGALRGSNPRKSSTLWVMAVLIRWKMSRPVVASLIVTPRIVIPSLATPKIPIPATLAPLILALRILAPGTMPFQKRTRRIRGRKSLLLSRGSNGCRPCSLSTRAKNMRGFRGWFPNLRSELNFWPNSLASRKSRNSRNSGNSRHPNKRGADTGLSLRVRYYPIGLTRSDRRYFCGSAAVVPLLSCGNPMVAPRLSDAQSTPAEIVLSRPRAWHT